jgi:hypothetical protein
MRPWLKWLAGIAASVTSAVLIWVITTPPATRDGTTNPLTGIWTYRMSSTRDPTQSWEGRLVLTQEGGVLTGTMHFGATPIAIRGTVGNGFVEFSRPANPETEQKFFLTGTKNAYTGNYHNVGPPNYADQGTVSIERP